MNEKIKRPKKKKKKIFNKISTVIVLVYILLLLGILFYLNIIPVLYSFIILIFCLLLVFGLTILNLCNKKGLRFIGGTLNLIIIIILIIITYYVYNTLGFLFNITDGNYALKNYNVVVLKDSSYKELLDLNDKTIGISETSINDGQGTIEKIKKKITFVEEKYVDITSLTNAIVNNEVEAIILEDSELQLLKDENIETYNNLRIIYKIKIKYDIKSIQDAVNINKEVFNVYISGIDTYGKINASSRSDVNMVVTVNPKEERILITWIPRDYYIKINNSEYKDKLTHAGIYGIDTSIYAIENLLDIDVNYYVKVNFTSLVKVVDLLGGISVYNDEAFTSIDNYFFKKGNITLDGTHALSYVRERKNVSGGDVGRGQHQIDVLEALIKKAMSPKIITTYNSLLKSLDGAFVTNMSQNTMLSFIKREINKPRDWQIDDQVLTGTSVYDYTYTYKKITLSVMKPDEDVVSAAKLKIKET